MQWNAPFYCEFDGKSMETDKKTWSEFPNGGKAFAEKILASEQRNKSKRAGLWESQSGIHIGMLTIWARSFEISSTRIGEPVLMMMLKSQKTKTLAVGLINRTSSMLDDIEPKTVHEDEEGDP